MEIGRLTFIRCLGISKRSGLYRNADFNWFICNDPAPSCKNLVNFRRLTAEFKKGKRVQCYNPWFLF